MTTRFETFRTPLRRIFALSLLLFLVLSTIACRQGVREPETAEKVSLALAVGACGEGLLAMRAWECLSGGMRAKETAGGLVQP